MNDRLLAIDVGTGTTDILLFEPGRPVENSPKLVVPSATQLAAARIAAATTGRRPVVFAGATMGGGPVTTAARRHLAAGLEVFATPEAAVTFFDDLEQVTAMGVRLVGEDEVAGLERRDAVPVRSGDLDLAALLDVFERLGLPTAFGGGCIAVQDHGFSPQSSNRAFRFEQWRRALAERAPLDALVYDADAIPDELTRMRAAAAELAALPRVTAADTGPAALLGALEGRPARGGDAGAGGEDRRPFDRGDEPVVVEGGDRDAQRPGNAVLVNVGNGHTICAMALAGRLAAVYEDHTSRLDAALLEANLRRFLDGELDDDEVREAGGHGALGGPVPAGLPILVTGPHRDLLRGTDLPVAFPAPFGDMMMTGPAGLIGAWRRRHAARGDS